MKDKQHWEAVYDIRAAEAVSWFQPRAVISLALIRQIAPSLDCPIIDVGAGASVLVDDLLEAGYRDLTVLDIAGAALSAAKARVGSDSAQKVVWIEDDVRAAALHESVYGVWHDRAVFHFLTDPADRAAYVRQVRHALRPGGYVLVATFAEDGPASCSGLPVARYSPEALHREFGAAFDLISTEREVHTTPTGARQAFIYCLCRLEGGRDAGLDASSVSPPETLP